MKESTYKTAAVSQRGNGRTGARRIACEQLRADARKGLPNAARRQPHGRTEGEIHRMGRAAHDGRW